MLPPDLKKIPGQLCKLPQWVCWRPDKTPIDPKTGASAKSNDPKTWGSFAAAIKYWDAHRDKVAGIGFVFSATDPYTGIDLDEARHPETGEIEPYARRIIDRLPTYAEISPSGCGFHILLIAKLPPGSRRKGRVEMYDSLRFFTVTGHHLEGTPATIEPCQAELEALHLEIFGKPPEDTRAAPDTSAKVPPQAPGPLELSDREIIDRANQARNADKFAKLWRGDTSEYPSPSEATAALLNLLAYYCGRDPAKIDRLFRQSGLMRPKWDRPQSGSTWGALEVGKAISRATEFYTPRQRTASPSPAKPKDQPKENPPPEKKDDSEGGKIYNETINKFNKIHAVVMIGGKCLVLNEVIDTVTNRPDITFSSITDFRNYYGNVKVKLPKEDGGFNNIPAASLWLDSQDRRQYKGIIFSPKKNKKGYYNLYKGLNIKQKKGDWHLFKNHILEVIASGNVKYFNYLMKWMALLLRDPGGERPGTSIVLRGRQGSGKGIFASQFGEIISPHFLHITNPGQLVGRFNHHLKDCLLCFVDEGLWAGDKMAEGVLKGMITEKYVMVEPKGKDAFLVENHIRLIVASNSEWVIPAGLEERRFFVLDVSNKYMQDYNYFKAIIDEMDNGGREAMLYDLLEMKVNINDLRKIPRTNALLDQIIHTMPTIQKFWFERLREGTQLKDDSTWEDFTITSALFEEYQVFAQNCGERFRLIPNQFAKELRRLCPMIRRARRVISFKDRWVLHFPELDICRQDFENLVGVKVGWEPDADPKAKGFMF
jgi:hypothetical protein